MSFIYTYLIKISPLSTPASRAYTTHYAKRSKNAATVLLFLKKKGLGLSPRPYQVRIESNFTVPHP